LTPGYGSEFSDKSGKEIKSFFPLIIHVCDSRQPSQTSADIKLNDMKKLNHSHIKVKIMNNRSHLEKGISKISTLLFIYQSTIESL
jgi:hypothetical protein